MKKLNKRFVSKINGILAMLVLLLGFSCNSDDDDPIPAEYGSPHADFKVKGKVTDENKKAIPGIRIHSMTIRNNEVLYHYSDTTYTNGQGEYTIQANPLDIEQIKIFYEDIDGEENGSFKTDSIVILQEDIHLTGASGHWFEGSETKTIDIKLKNK